MLGGNQFEVRAREDRTDLNLRPQFLSHRAHGFISNHGFLLEAEQYRSNALHSAL